MLLTRLSVSKAHVCTLDLVVDEVSTPLFSECEDVAQGRYFPTKVDDTQLG